MSSKDEEAVLEEYQKELDDIMSELNIKTRIWFDKLKEKNKFTKVVM